MRNIIHKNRISLFVGLAVFSSLIVATSRLSANSTTSSASLAPAQAEASCGFLENGDFESGTDSWIESGVWELVDGETGQALALSKPAFRQLVNASPDEAFTLTGVYKTQGTGDDNWTGIGVDFLNGDTKIGDSLIQITESADDFVQFSVEGTTPAETTDVNVWIYSNNGVTLVVDNLELVWETCNEIPLPTETPEVLPETTPTNTPEPPVDGDYCEPLVNGDFEAGINPWNVSGDWDLVPGRTGTAVSIITPFVRQQLDTVPGKAFTIQGYFRTEGVFGPNWTGIGVDYENSKNQKIGDNFFRITESVEEYQQFEITGTTPEDADAIELWFYSGKGVTLFVDDVVLEWENCSTEPPVTPEPPTVTPEPTEPVEETPTPVPPTPTPEPTEEPEPPANLESEIIFDEAVSDNWILDSWGTVSKNPLNKDPVFTGENSLEVSLADAWSTLYFEAVGGHPANQIYSASFDVYGSSSTVQTFEIELLTRNYQQITTATVSVLPGQWSNVEVVFTDINTAELLGYVTMKNASTNDTFYIDNLSLAVLPESPGAILDEHIYLPVAVR